MSSSAAQDSVAPVIVDASKTDSTVAPADSAVAPADSTLQQSSSSVQDSVLESSSSIAQDSVPASSSSEVQDSAVVAAASSSSIAASSSSVSRRDILGPTKVSKVYGMDEIKGKYKSPKKALFMSLVVPGSGQLYVGGSTFTNVRGGVYLALEAGLWGGWYYFSIYKYKDQVKKYKKFAKQNFSIAQYEDKMHSIFNSLDGTDEEANFRIRYMSGRESYCEGIYGSATANGCYNSEKTFNNDANHVNKFTGETLGDDLDKVDLYNSSEVYSQISNSNYVLGWLDVEDEALVADLDLEDSESEKVSLGVSENQKKYRSMRNKANDYANLQAWFFGGIILNHLVSAIDAALTANSHNKTLYEEKLSWYDRIHLEGYIVPIQGERATVINAFWSF